MREIMVTACIDTEGKKCPFYSEFFNVERCNAGEKLIEFQYRPTGVIGAQCPLLKGNITIGLEIMNEEKGGDDA
jgi:hypothetical protein